MVWQYYTETRCESEGIVSMIEQVTSGSVAKNRKLNEVIRAINALQSMTVRQGSDSELPKLIIADRGNVLITTGGSNGGGGGGGGDDGFDLVTFDVVEDNLAVQYQWRAEQVT